MLTPVEWIISDLQQVRRYACDMLEHVDEQDWFRQSKPGINHIAWQVGHMAIAQYGLCLKRIRGERAEDEALLATAEYARLFGKGSVPSSHAADYPSPEQIRKSFDLVHNQVIAETQQLSEAILAESAGPLHPMFSTKEGALRFSPKHEMLHVGQIGLTRRLFEQPIVR